MTVHERSNSLQIYKDGAYKVVVENHRSYEMTIFGITRSRSLALFDLGREHKNMDSSSKGSIEDIP